MDFSGHRLLIIKQLLLGSHILSFIFLFLAQYEKKIKISRTLVKYYPLLVAPEDKELKKLFKKDYIRYKEKRDQVIREFNQKREKKVEENNKKLQEAETVRDELQQKLESAQPPQVQEASAAPTEGEEPLAPEPIEKEESDTAPEGIEEESDEESDAAAEEVINVDDEWNYLGSLCSNLTALLKFKHFRKKQKERQIMKLITKALILYGRYNCCKTHTISLYFTMRRLAVTAQRAKKER